MAALFEPMERLALLIACLCHDLDHRGAPVPSALFSTNAQWPLRVASPRPLTIDFDYTIDYYD